MKRLLIASIMMVAMLALVANADEPPAYGSWNGGWGNCFVNWERSSGGFNSGLVLYRLDPGYPGGAGWMVYTGDPQNLAHINYEDIWIKLWIQLYIVQTYDWSLYEIHRCMGGDPLGEDFELILSGTLQGNHPEWVLVTNFPGNAQDYLEFLHFQHNVAGYTGDERDIPIEWRAKYGAGLTPGTGQEWPASGWSAPIVPDGVGNIVIPERVPACDKWYQFRIAFHLNYHEPDGYYELHAEGCPSPGM